MSGLKELKEDEVSDGVSLVTDNADDIHESTRDILSLRCQSFRSDADHTISALVDSANSNSRHSSRDEIKHDQVVAKAIDVVLEIGCGQLLSFDRTIEDDSRNDCKSNLNAMADETVSMVAEVDNRVLESELHVNIIDIDFETSPHCVSDEMPLLKCSNDTVCEDVDVIDNLNDIKISNCYGHDTYRGLKSQLLMKDVEVAVDTTEKSPRLGPSNFGALTDLMLNLEHISQVGDDMAPAAAAIDAGGVCLEGQAFLINDVEKSSESDNDNLTQSSLINIEAEMEVRSEYEVDIEATIALIVDDKPCVPIIDQCVKICEEKDEIWEGDIVNANSTSSPFLPNLDFDEEQRSVAEDNKDAKLDTRMSTFVAQSEFDFDANDCCDEKLYTPVVSRTESWDDTYAMMLAEVDHNTGPERKLFINIDNICDATVSNDTVDAIKTACGAVTVAESPPLSSAVNLQVGDNSLCIIDSGTYTNIMTLSKDYCAPETRMTAAYESVTSNCDRPGIGEDVPLSAATDETEYGDTYDSDYCFKIDSSELKIESAEDAEIGVNPHFMQDGNLFSTLNEFGAADANETSSSMLGNVDECEYRSTTVSMHFLSTDSSISTNSMALDGLTDDLLAQNDFEVIEVPVEDSCTQLDRAAFEDDVAYAGERLNMDLSVAAYEAADIILSTMSSGKCKTVKDIAVDTANHSETAEREYGTFYIYDPLVADDTIQFKSHTPCKGMDHVALHAADGAASITECATQDHLSPIICSPINDTSPANEIENSLKINTFAKRLDYLLSVDKLNSPKKVQDDDLIGNEGTVKKSATNEKSALIVDDITIQKTKLAYESIVLEKSQEMDTRSKNEASRSSPLQISSISAQNDGLSTDFKKNQEVGFPSAPAHNMVSVENFCTISIAESTIDGPGRLRIGDHLLSNAQDVDRNVKSNISLFKRLFGKKDTATEEKNFKPACCAGVLSAGSCYSTFSEELLGSGPKRTSTVSGNSMLSTEDSDEGFLEV